jgi:NADPH:quinone reductase-like Zn-dependent oxidoreductase
MLRQDLLVSMGLVDRQPLGLEGSGVIENVGSEVADLRKGDRVFYLHTGCFATALTLPAASCVKIPATLSYEEAASMPCVYATAIHCLIEVGRLRKGESVLIHSACGGTTCVS